MARLNEHNFVAFFDILGTRESVSRGEFSDLDVLDFANATGVMALHFPDIRFAAFSDSVVISCRPKRISDFLTALNFLYSSWLSDLIFVRGGLAYGELTWVVQPSIDHLWRGAPNFAYARIYGKGLLEAIDLQEKSGPGMVCFVGDTASSMIKKDYADCILPGPVDTLVLTTSYQQAFMRKMFSHLAKERPLSRELMKHVKATRHYLTQSKKSRKGLPPELSMVYVTKLNLKNRKRPPKEV